MSRSRTIFLILSLLFHIGVAAFTLIVLANQENIKFLIGLMDSVMYLVFGAIFGLLVFLVLIYYQYVNLRSLNKEKNHLAEENTRLKAKLFDMEEAGKDKIQASSDETSKN